MFIDRKFVLSLALVGTILVIVTVVLLSLPLGLGKGSNSPEGVSLLGFLLVIVGELGGGALVVAGGIVALIQTAQQKRWRWFGILLGEGILLLVLASVISFYAPWAFLILPLTLVVYGVVGPMTPSVKQG